MSEVIIFGNKDTAELAYWYLKNDTNYRVASFTVSSSYIKKDTYKKLPLVPFEKLEEYYDPRKYLLFAPMTGKKMNRLRENIYLAGKKKGFRFVSYKSSHAKVFTKFIGENCFILENNTIQPFTKIGNNTMIWSGNHIGHHSIIHDHVFFTSHVVLSGNCTVNNNCVLSINSSVRDFSFLEEGTLIGMGSNFVGTRTDAWSVYLGNPAKKVGRKKSIDVY